MNEDLYIETSPASCAIGLLQGVDNYTSGRGILKAIGEYREQFGRRKVYSHIVAVTTQEEKKGALALQSAGFKKAGKGATNPSTRNIVTVWVKALR